VAARIRLVDYLYTTVPDKPGEACNILFKLSAAAVNLLAFSIVPMGTDETQLVLFPDNLNSLVRASEDAGFLLSRPQRAILVQGDDELGALVDVHRKLGEASINVFSSSGVTDGKGSFGYVMYIKSQDLDNAARILGL